MQLHKGGCHCGAVAFEVLRAGRSRADRLQLLDVRQDRLSAPHRAESSFRLLRGEDKLATYTFNTGAAKHMFCSVCGIKSFYVPRSHPDGYSVNFRCLECRGLHVRHDDGIRRPGLGTERRRTGAAGDRTSGDQILMPALSPTMEEGKLAKWLVKEGDTVKSGDILAEIETDKATMEFEAVDEGKIGKILVPEGTEGVKVNAPIAVLLGEGEEAGTRPRHRRPSMIPSAMESIKPAVAKKPAAQRRRRSRSAVCSSCDRTQPPFAAAQHRRSTPSKRERT